MSSASDKRFWDRLARKYAANPIADPDGYERSLEATRRYLAPGHSVLEVGCGTGTTALKLAPMVTRILATDISDEMVAIAREKAIAAGANNVEFVAGEPASLSAPDGAFDVAIGFNILHLIEDRPAALAGLRRVLKPGGVFISKTPCLAEANPLYRVALPVMQALGRAPYVAFLSTEALEREISWAGFDIVERARHGSKTKDARPFLVARKV